MKSSSKLPKCPRYTGSLKPKAISPTSWWYEDGGGMKYAKDEEAVLLKQLAVIRHVRAGARKPEQLAKSMRISKQHAHRLMVKVGCRPVWLTPMEQERLKGGAT